MTHRDDIIAAATRLTEDEGWSAVTMSRLADEVGVSRQTVYNEVGSKPELAQTMVLTELASFLAVVDSAFEANPDDVVAGVRVAVRGVLEMAENHPLLTAIVAVSHGADSELLPWLTTRSESVLNLATTDIAGRLRPYARHLGRRQEEAVADVIVRTVLSHVMQPGRSPRATADDLAWVVSRLLAEAA